MAPSCPIQEALHPSAWKKAGAESNGDTEGSGAACGQSILCFGLNKYEVRSHEPLQVGGGEAAPHSPYLQFSIPTPGSAPLQLSLQHLVRVSRRFEMLFEL